MTLRTIGKTYAGAEYHRPSSESDFFIEAEEKKAVAQSVERLFEKIQGRNLAMVAYDLFKEPDGAGRVQVRAEGYAVEHVLPKSYLLQT